MQAPERRQPLGIVFDSSIDDGIDRVLGLALTLAYHSKQEARLLSLSTSRNNLKIAGFCDAMERFYTTNLSIGMNEKGAAATTLPPMLVAPMTKTTPEGRMVYNRLVEKLNDTADPVALIRNALTAQQDQTAAVILAGNPVNLLGLLALPGSKAVIQKKVRMQIGRAHV